ncbi:serine/threonine-protein phosphatase [bacterium]|nr:serine/threonine-protein phosphatase [bacterium]
MIDPKTFYRELDNILKKVGQGGSGDEFFLGILAELDNSFGAKLKILNSHIYEKRNANFVRIRSCHKCRGIVPAKQIAFDSLPIQQVMDEGVIIYDGSEAVELFSEGGNSDVVIAALHVHKPVRSWLIVFQLSPLFQREEVLLFLNAMRPALNYRLFSEMMKNDLKRAEQIQRSLLPANPPKVEGYDIHALSLAAEVVGGDFYEFFQLRDNDFGVAIGDASGHGMPAALLVRDVVIGLRMGLASETRLVHTVEKLNYVIQQSTYSTNFVSMFIGEIEDGGHLFYVNAGHCPPIMVKGSEITELPATGITLGFLPEIDLKRGYVNMPPGSVLVMYTDGIIEREQREDEQFEVERLKDLIVTNQNKSAADIIKEIIKAVDVFGREKSLEDDATLVVIKRLDETESNGKFQNTTSK